MIVTTMNTDLGTAGDKNPYRSPNYAQDIYRRIERPNVGLLANADWNLWATEYRGFRLEREDPQTTFWIIKTSDGGEPPVRLRSSFTSKMRAEQAIADFIAGEQSKEPKDYPI